jgi:hypothetical protein
MQIQSGTSSKNVGVRLGDITSEPAAFLRERVTGDAELTGTVVEYVKIGNPPETFARMKVNGIETPVLVPIKALQK